jgi:hypothetical protein
VVRYNVPIPKQMHLPVSILASATSMTCSNKHLLAQVWQSAAGSNSPLLAPAALARLPDADVVLLPPLAEVLLMQHGDRMNAAATAAVCRSLVLAGLHHVQQARRAATDTITRCVKQAPSVAGVQPRMASC